MRQGFRLTFSAIMAMTGGVAYAAERSLEEAHDALMADKSYVFDYTVQETQQRVARQSSPSAFWDMIGQLMVYLFWTAVVIGALLLIYFLVTELLRLKGIKIGRKVKAGPKLKPVQSYTPEIEAAKALLGDVDDLAAQGRFDEAIHTLLLRSIADIRKNRPRAVPKAMTSREISHITILSDLARRAFRNIGDRVERSYFGGQGLTEVDFKRSRDDYETFAFERGQSR